MSNSPNRLENDPLDDLVKDLSCPISCDLMEDPIIVPCCTKAFERISLVQHFSVNGSVCPLCRKNIDDYDPLTAPKNLSICALVESIKKRLKGKEKEPSPPKVPDEKWNASLTTLYDEQKNVLPIAELKLELENAKFVPKPALFIAVVDKSGSMAGHAFQQVQSALLHIASLTHDNPFVKLIIITYNNMAEVINLGVTQLDAHRVIRGLTADGGTSFRAAFNKLREVLSTYSPENIGNVTVAFMTDGQDNGSGNGCSVDEKNKLVSDCDEMLRKAYKGPLSIHAIGFGRECDKDLLEGLRKLGPTPGTFRYAEPDENSDTLCGKMTGLFEVVSKSATVPLKLYASKLTFYGSKSSSCQIQFPVNEHKTGEYCCWILVNSLDDLGTLKIDSSTGEPATITISLNANPSNLLQKWFSIVLDELAAVTLELSKQNKNDYGLDLFDLHCALLEQKCDALNSQIDVTNRPRLDYIIQSIGSLRAGLGINIGKLSDLRFASQYLSVEPVVKAVPKALPAPQPVPALKTEKQWTEYRVYYNRNNKDKKRNSLQEAIMNNNPNKITADIREALSASSRADLEYRDIDGNTALMLAAYSGHSLLLKEILNKYPDLDLDLENAKNETATTMAIKARGFWKTLETLINAGASIPAHRRKALEQYAIDNGFPTTATFIGNAADTTTNINDGMTNEYIMFVYNRAIANKADFDVDNYLTIAVKKKMKSLIESLVTKHNAKPTLQLLMDLCVPESPQDLELTKYFLDLNKIVANGETKYPLLDAEDDNGDSLLFRASERGSLDHVKLFISLGAKVDQANKLGNTALWIACWKRYPCIIRKLLSSEADVNYCNLKGNPPLVSICQKGPKKIAEILLETGAKVNHLNSNGDSMILICCRNGQHEVLELLLTKADPEFVKHKAHIDGFSAILAATEANRPECIKVLHEYGINLEEKTDDDNIILAGATSLHLAAYYGRTEAAQALINYGASLNSRDINGQTPLHIAVIQGNVPIIKLLRNAGSDLNAQDKHGNSAATYCRGDLRKTLVNPALSILMKLSRGEFSNKEQVMACELLSKNQGVIGCLSPRDTINITDTGVAVTPLMEAVIHSNYVVAKTFLEMNADPNVKNLHGLICQHWASWIDNGKMKSLFQNIDTSPELNRLINASKNSHQDRMVLYLGNKPKVINVVPDNSLVKRMDCNINNICSESTSENRDQSKEKSPSDNNMPLVEILDKSLVNKEDFTETLKWQAKVFTVSMIASGKTDLSAQEVLALYSYTAYPGLSSVLNDYKFNAVKKCLENALIKLPPFQGEVYIGANNVDRKLFTIGKEISWNTGGNFTSATTMWRVATENTKDFTTKKQGTVFIIHCKSGRFISSYSRFIYDMEVLFLPNTKFRVKNWYMGDVICLGQANIREHTFKIKPENMEKMLTTNSALIIELVEF